MAEREPPPHEVVCGATDHACGHDRDQHTTRGRVTGQSGARFAAEIVPNGCEGASSMTRRHDLQQGDRNRRKPEESTEGVEIARTVAGVRRLGLTVSVPIAARGPNAPAQALS